MDEAGRERLRAYGYLLVFAVAVVAFGRYSADTVKRATTLSPLPATPLLIGAVVVSLASIAPLVVTFRPSAAGKMVATMREKARRADKTVSFQNACRSASLYVAALSGTPLLYGVMLLFLVGEFQLLMLMLPAAAILGAVGWVVLGRFFKELSSRFLR